MQFEILPSWWEDEPKEAVLLEDQYMVLWGHHDAEWKQKTKQKQKQTKRKPNTANTQKATSGMVKCWPGQHSWRDNGLCIIKRIGVARSKSNRTRNKTNERHVRKATRTVSKERWNVHSESTLYQTPCLPNANSVPPWRSELKSTKLD